MKREDIKNGAIYVLMVTAVVALGVALAVIVFVSLFAMAVTIEAIAERGDWSYLWCIPASIVGGVAAFFVSKLALYIMEWHL